jgi:hypothetical protein
MREIRSACATSPGVENNKVPPNVTGCRFTANKNQEIKEPVLKIKTKVMLEGEGLRLGESQCQCTPGPSLAALSLLIHSIHNNTTLFHYFSLFLSLGAITRG